MCDCIQTTNELLERDHNSTLVVNLFGTPRAFISVTQLKTGRGQKKASLMIASFCPFCGEKYPEMTKT